MNKRQYKDMLDDVCSDICPKTKDCILKDFLVSAHASPRMLVQLKCVDRYKRRIARNAGRAVEDIAWNEALDSWYEHGHAKEFAEIYEEGVQYRTIYNKIFKKKK